MTSLLDDLNWMMLPGTLEDSFEAHRENLLQAACEPFSEERLTWWLREVKALRQETDPLIGFNDIFDPFLGKPHGMAKLPPGTIVVLPPVPSAIVTNLPPKAPLVELAGFEAARLAESMANYGDEEVAALCTIATAGYADAGPTSIGRRPEMIDYIAANASLRVLEYLGKNYSVLSSLPYRQVVFPDMVEERRNRLREYIAENPSLFSERDLECYTEEDIRAITHDVRTLVLSPRVRHFGLCRLCLTRVSSWQTSLAEFQKLATAGVPHRLDA